MKPIREVTQLESGPVMCWSTFITFKRFEIAITEATEEYVIGSFRSHPQYDTLLSDVNRVSACLKLCMNDLGVV